MAEGTSNTAGELNVKFTANVAPLKDAAAEAKQSLDEVGSSGQSAGAGIGMGMAAAAAAAVVASKVIVQFMNDMAALAKETAAYEANRNAAFASQESTLGSLLNAAQQTTDYDQKRSHINQQLADTQAKIGDDAAKYLDTHGSLIDSAAVLLGLEKSTAQVLKEQAVDMQTAADIRERQIQALNEATAKQYEQSNLLKQAALTGDPINVEREKARQEIEALERKRDGIRGAGSYAAVNEVEEAIRLRKLELEEVIKRIEAEREAKNMRDMEHESAKALHEAWRQQAEEQRDREREEREHAREMAHAARERLQLEKEITREKNAQRAGFGINNVTFFGSRAMQSAINQREISQMWSD